MTAADRPASRSVAFTGSLDDRLAGHLLRPDGQEDICFALWHPSVGRRRSTAVVCDVVAPRDGERHVHGNASFEDRYFLRACAAAADASGGVALLHSHPDGLGWQGLSDDDAVAEGSPAARAEALTGLPLVGLTLAGDRTWSARWWAKTGPRMFDPRWCDNVRVAASRLRVSWNDDLRPPPPSGPRQTRTVSAWGPEVQATLARLRFGIVGAGSVGALVGESLARMGATAISVIDFDTVKTHNLDRLLHASAADAAAARAKASSLTRGLAIGATAADIEFESFELSVVEDDGYRAALDCDVIFSCVDRPWPRRVLNLVAYAHLIPVVDGGVALEVGPTGMRGAEWRAHVAAPGRRCLECLDAYNPADVQAERDGLLDDPRYIASLPEAHRLRRNENVFAFAQAAAAAETLQMLSMVVAPGGLADPGAQLFHFATGTVERDERDCEANCLHAGAMLAQGDASGFTVTGVHPPAHEERTARQHQARRPSVRARRAVDDTLWWARRKTVGR